MLEDNTVNELLDGHGEPQSEGSPALNDGVYDYRCLCKSPPRTSSSYHDHRRRSAPLSHGHLSSLQLTFTSSSGTWTILSRPVFSSRDSKSRRSGIISKLFHIHPSNSAQRRAFCKAEHTVDPPRSLVASRGESLRLTLSCYLHTSVCAVVRSGYGMGIALPAVGLRWQRGANPFGASPYRAPARFWCTTVRSGVYPRIEKTLRVKDYAI